MAHPHAEHRQHKVEKQRVAHITKGYATGGGVHSDEAADKKLIRHTVKKAALRMHGDKPKARMDHRARGGRTKHKGTTVNVIMPQHAMGGAPPMAGPPMAPPMPPPRPPMPPAGAMPPGAAPGAPMPPPGMPMRHTGGSAYAKGGAVKDGPAWKEGLESGTQVQHADGKSDGKNIGRGRVVTFRVGGRVGQSSGTAGAGTAYHETTKRAPVKDAGVDKPNRAMGGKIEAPKGVASATKLPGGGGGGEARLAKAKRARRDYKAA